MERWSGEQVLSLMWSTPCALFVAHLETLKPSSYGHDPSGFVKKVPECHHS